MIHELSIKNFGPIKELHVPSLGGINIFIGANGTGKTYLLKAIYASIKSIEQYKRGKENKTLSELLSEKFYWTFQSDNLGSLVRKPAKEELFFKMKDKVNHEFSFTFKESTTKLIKQVKNDFEPTNTNSIFLPAKEILSARNIIITSKENFKEFGFDDTYYDLAKALSPVTRGKNYRAFSEARNKITELIKGKLSYKNDTNEWVFIDNNKLEFPIGITSEGVKKISIVETLLGNRYLSKDSMIFIDEPESNLHPGFLSEYMEILFQLSKIGMQFFLATHSYFVVKKFYIIAQREKVGVPIISFEDNIIKVSDLKEDLPDNPIIKESERLYMEEIGL